MEVSATELMGILNKIIAKRKCDYNIYNYKNIIFSFFIYVQMQFQATGSLKFQLHLPPPLFIYLLCLAIGGKEELAL